jgi:hypothetical protein
MVSLHLVLLVFAFVCFVLSALPLASPYWNRLISVGLACWVGALLFG